MPGSNVEEKLNIELSMMSLSIGLETSKDKGSSFSFTVHPWNGFSESCVLLAVQRGGSSRSSLELRSFSITICWWLYSYPSLWIKPTSWMYFLCPSLWICVLCPFFFNIFFLLKKKNDMNEKDWISTYEKLKIRTTKTKGENKAKHPVIAKSLCLS